MEILVDNRPARPFSEKDRKKIGKVRAALPCTATVLTIGEAQQKLRRRGKVVNVIMALLMALCLVAFAVLEITATDSFFVYAGFAFLVVMAFIGILWYFVSKDIDRLGPRVVAAAGISPPAGTEVTATHSGLTIGPRQIAWPDITVTVLGVQIISDADSNSYLQPDRFWLKCGGEMIHLDQRLMKNGLVLMNAIYKAKLAG